MLLLNSSGIRSFASVIIVNDVVARLLQEAEKDSKTLQSV